MFCFRCELMSGLVIICLLVLAGCGSEKHADSKQGESAPDTAAASQTGSTSDSAAESVISLTATEFAREVYQDKAATAAKYGGKQIRLTGEVAAFHRTLTGSGFMFLDGLSNDSLADHVRLNMHEQERSPWTRVTMGQKVTVQGLCPKVLFFLPELEECRIIEIQGKKKPDYISAERLAEELAEDSQHSDEKYERQLIYLTGTLKTLDLDHSQIVLGTENKKSALLRSEYIDDLSHLKPGEEIKILGKYVTDREHDLLLELKDIMLIEPQPSEGNLKPTRMSDGFPQFTADRMVEAYRSNPRQFLYRYRNLDQSLQKKIAEESLFSESKNQIQVEGVIEKTVHHDAGWSVYLKNSHGHEIICTFFLTTEKETEDLKAGNKVIIRGKLFQLLASGPDEAIQLIACKVISSS